MSDYIAPGGYYTRRAPVKSVYYPPQPENLPAPQGSSSQLPPGAVPAINLPTSGYQHQPYLHQQQQQVPLQQQPPFQAAPQVQYQNNPQQSGFQLQAPIQPQAASLPLPLQQATPSGPVFVDSDYAAAGWGAAPYHSAPVRVVNQPSQNPLAGAEQQQQSAAMVAARSEYEQAMAQAQLAAERLNQLSISASQMQFAAPQLQDFGAVNQSVASLQPPASQGQYQSAPILQQPQHQQQQVRFGNVSELGNDSGSAYRFEEAAPSPSRRNFARGQAESVYIGMPNTLQYASNRPRDYHYNPQYQHPGQQSSGAQKEGGTNLRAAYSEEDVRTAIEGIATAAVLASIIVQDAAAESAHGGNYASHVGSAQQSHGGGLQASSSDYHFDALRGLNSALDQRS